MSDQENKSVNGNPPSPPAAPPKQPEIKQITATSIQGTQEILVIGLGRDNRIYLWNAGAGRWMPNWAPPPSQIVTPQNKLMVPQKPKGK